MTAPLRPTMTLDQFDSLHAAVHKARAGSATVKVDKIALDRLLQDHGKACALLDRLGALSETDLRQYRLPDGSTLAHRDGSP